ncbi:MAG: foldase [Ruminiclostridium sp.]|nr:foldase [Ruminiclostridium sp.]MBP3855243.1 foldase [Ruminiclostridium sp.]
MAEDPELEAEYEKEIENMKRLDEQNVRTHEMNGGKLIAQGWAIDKDGGISKWSIGNPGGNTRVKSPTEYANELYERKKEKGRIVLKSRTNTVKNKPAARFDRKA